MIRYFKILNAFLVVCALWQSQICYAQYIGRVGTGGVTVTPRGINFKEYPELKISQNSFVINNAKPALPLEQAKEILKNTNLITGAKLNHGQISQQSLAFNSILHYQNKESAKLALAEIFNFAKYPEARAYAMMGLYYFDGKDVLAKLLAECATADKGKKIELAVFINGNFHMVEQSLFFDTFLKNVSVFISDI